MSKLVIDKIKCNISEDSSGDTLYFVVAEIYPGGAVSAWRVGPISAWDDVECGDVINTDKVIVGHQKAGPTYFVAMFDQDDGLDVDSREQRILKGALKILNDASWVRNNHDPGRWTGDMLLYFSELMKNYNDDVLGAQILGQGEMMALLDDADYRVTFKVA